MFQNSYTPVMGQDSIYGEESYVWFECSFESFFLIQERQLWLLKLFGKEFRMENGKARLLIQPLVLKRLKLMHENSI